MLFDVLPGLLCEEHQQQFATMNTRKIELLLRIGSIGGVMEHLFSFVSKDFDGFIVKKKDFNIKVYP
jgi:hypothetical protein